MRDHTQPGALPLRPMTTGEVLDAAAVLLRTRVWRLIGLGARRVDVGQKDVSWVVLADPEGNEFCVLRALTNEDRAQRRAQGID